MRGPVRSQVVAKGPCDYWNVFKKSSLNNKQVYSVSRSMALDTCIDITEHIYTIVVTAT